MPSKMRKEILIGKEVTDDLGKSHFITRGRGQIVVAWEGVSAVCRDKSLHINKVCLLEVCWGEGLLCFRFLFLTNLYTQSGA